MANTKSFNSGMDENPLDKENKPINVPEDTMRLESEITKLKSEIKFLKFQLEQNDSEIIALNTRTESLQNQIVQILACGNPEKEQIVEQFKKDLLTHDPTYFEHLTEHCAFSSGWNEANKKV